MPPPPPFSLRGVYHALRWPLLSDVVFSLKSLIAAILALGIGFATALENPYWSVMTIYIMEVQPQAGAMRTRGLFRLLGTILGGAAILILEYFFASSPGVMFILVGILFVVGLVLRDIDRTPANYTWFSFSITAGVIGFINLMQPASIFLVTASRVAECVVGILALLLVDSLIKPGPMLPDFLASTHQWRDATRRWLAATMAFAAPPSNDLARRKMLREQLRTLVGTLADLDAKAIQLPYDIVDTPPRGSDVNLLRITVVRLICDLSVIEQWQRIVGQRPAPPKLIEAAEAVQEWAKRDSPPAAETDALLAHLAADEAALSEDAELPSILHRSMLLRLITFVQDWRDVSAIMQSVATRSPLPARLRAAAARAKPKRTTDYGTAMRDHLPTALAIMITGAVWYFGAWTSGTNAVLFAAVGCCILTMQEQRAQSGPGILVWITFTTIVVCFYQFVVLPQVTTFEAMAAVIALYLFPLGMFMRMSPVGMLLIAWTSAFLALQNIYATDFERSIQSLGGSAAGLLVAAGALYVTDYNRARWIARRQIRALRRDIVDAATARRVPDQHRFRDLTIDRFSLTFQRLEMLPPDDPMQKVNMIGELRIGLNLLILRAAEAEMDAEQQRMLKQLRGYIATMFRAHSIALHYPAALPRLLDEMLAQFSAGHMAHRPALLAATAGLRLALSPDDQEHLEHEALPPQGAPPEGPKSQDSGPQGQAPA